MRNFKLFIVTLSICSISIGLKAQNTQIDCTRNLNEARTAYSNGNLYSIPGKLSNCLNDGFSKTEKIEAYRLLALTYININQQEKAKESLIKLLKTKTDFRVFKNQDPEELVSLYNKIDTDVKYYLGLTIGGNLSFIQPDKVLFSTNPVPEQINITYTALPAYSFGAQFIKPINDLHLQASLKFQEERYQYTEIIPHINLNNIISTVDYTGKSQGINLNLNARYQKDFYEWKPFVSAGISLRANLSNTIRNYTSIFSESVEQELIVNWDNNENTTFMNLGLTGAAGSMIKIGENYLEIKASATQYILNHNKKSVENQPDLTIANGGYVMYNNFSSLLLKVDLSFNMPFFNFK